MLSNLERNDQRRKEKKVGVVRNHFLDSGAFTMLTRARRYAAEHHCSEWKFYDTDEFWEYIDRYGRWLKGKIVIDKRLEHPDHPKRKLLGTWFPKDEIVEFECLPVLDAVDCYANLDAIGNAEISYRNLKYLEKEHGLNPVPVISAGSDHKWLKKHMKDGYDFIAFGGLAKTSTREHIRKWLDSSFEIVCSGKDRLPSVKIHGFGITYPYMMWAYPWYSVDSTSWSTKGAYGAVLVPLMLPNGNFQMIPKDWKGGFDSKRNVRLIQFSIESAGNSPGPTHFLSMNKNEQKRIVQWFEYLGLRLGRFNIPLEELGRLRERHNKTPLTREELTVIEDGVLTRNIERHAANLLYFEELKKHIPEWPWPWKGRTSYGHLGSNKEGFGLNVY